MTVDQKLGVKGLELGGRGHVLGPRSGGTTGAALGQGLGLS